MVGRRQTNKDSRAANLEHVREGGIVLKRVARIANIDYYRLRIDLLQRNLAQGWGFLGGYIMSISLF